MQTAKQTVLTSREPTPMADVFISYSQQDVADARMLAALLEANGYTVWWDTNLEGGEQFRKKIASELAAARAVVVIWTKSSVASDWVQSEAGRALADQKLVPVRSSEIGYNEIPPPFENRHTLTVDKTEQILAAVAAQLAKPAASAPRWKVARYELLTWLGVIGGAITLMTNISGILKLSDAAAWLLSHWSALLKRLWQAILFFHVDVTALDAEFLTIGFLLTSAIMYSSFRPRTDTIRKSVATLVLPLICVLIIMAAGVMSIVEKSKIEGWKEGDRHIEKTMASAECVALMKWFVRNPGSEELRTEKLPEETQVKIYDCMREARVTEDTYFNELYWLTMPKGFDSVWLYIIVLRAVGSDIAMYSLILAVWTLPILLPFILYSALARVFPLKLQVSALSRRLWRTLLVFVGLIVMNYVAVSIEIAKRWFAAIPGLT